MKPTKREDDAIVDLLDVLLYEGVVVEADVLITVADIPLVGLKLRAALAGMSTMRDYGMFEDWDDVQREFARYEDRDQSDAITPGDDDVPDESSDADPILGESDPVPVESDDGET